MSPLSRDFTGVSIPVTWVTVDSELLDRTSRRGQRFARVVDGHELQTRAAERSTTRRSSLARRTDHVELAIRDARC